MSAQPAEDVVECTRRGDAVFTTCSCPPCTQRRRRKYKRARILGSASRPSPDRAWERIIALLDRGWTAPEIARASGLPGRYVEQLVSAYRTVGHRQHIGEVRTAILAGLPLTDPPPRPKVDATGTRRRLRALATLGWPVKEVAIRAGLEAHASALSQVRLFNQPEVKWRQVPVEWAEAIATVYREMMRTPGPSPQARAAARRAGWLTPMDWHNPDTDPPRKGQ